MGEVQGFFQHQIVGILVHQFHNNETYLICRNLSLGFATKARACKVAGQEGSPGVTSHALGSAKECEGMNPHTPK